MLSIRIYIPVQYFTTNKLKELKMDSYHSNMGSCPETNSSVLSVPRPMECLYEPQIPPFLSKTYDLVYDSELDRIISWSAKGNSFVVWDHVEFARLILPGNFKHNNFSSFVRQLNTYGFRKVDADKWEFMNEGFVRGQKHLLRTIQRRKSWQQPQLTGTGKAVLEGEIESVRKERSSMVQQLIELQHQQRCTFEHIELCNAKLQAAEKRQKQMVSFLAKMFHHPKFIQEMKDKKSITYPRLKRKLDQDHTYPPPYLSPPKGHDVAKEYTNLVSDEAIDHSNPFLDSSNNLEFGVVNSPFHDEMEMVNELLETQENAQVKSSGIDLLSFPEDLVAQGRQPGFEIPEDESIMWSQSQGFDDLGDIDIPVSSINTWNINGGTFPYNEFC